MTAKRLILFCALLASLLQADKHPFTVGETLKYDLKVNVIKAGHAKLQVIGEEGVDENQTYHIKYTVKSNRYVDRLFYVRDQVDSWLDKKGLFTHRLIKNIREGSYRYKLEAKMNYIDSTLTSEDDVFQIDSEIRDPFSLFYYLRSIPLKVGQKLSFKTFDNGQFVDFHIIVHRKENIRVPAGRFKCLVIEPYRKG